MRPGMIAFLVILLIIVVKDPKVLDEIVSGIVNLLNGGTGNG